MFRVCVCDKQELSTIVCARGCPRGEDGGDSSMPVGTLLAWHRVQLTWDYSGLL